MLVNVNINVNRGGFGLEIRAYSLELIHEISTVARSFELRIPVAFHAKYGQQMNVDLMEISILSRISLLISTGHLLHESQ